TYHWLGQRKICLSAQTQWRIIWTACVKPGLNDVSVALNVRLWPKADMRLCGELDTATLRGWLPLASVVVVISEPAAVASPSLSIIPAVTLAYRDARRILRAMPMLVVFAVLIALAVKVAEDFFPQRVWDGPMGTALSLALGAVESFCLTPIMMAFHRF